MTFAEKMKELRKQTGKSQEQVCKEMGIAISTLRYYENGRLPDTYQLKIIKNYYNVTYEYLLDDNCNNKSNKTLQIGKILNLSDKSIEKIIESKENSNLFNFFIENINLKSFIKMFEKYYTINEILKKDLYTLIYICDLKDYIIDRMQIRKEDDLIDYFKSCNTSIERLLSFVYSKENLYFSPSDSIYDLFQDSYLELYEIIFSTTYKKIDIKQRISDFISSLENFCELYEEVSYKFDQFKKMSYFDLITFLEDFFKKIGIMQVGLGSEHYINILGKYINHINSDLR